MQMQEPTRGRRNPYMALMFGALLAVLALALFASTAKAQEPTCADFETQAEAQFFFGDELDCPELPPGILLDEATGAEIDLETGLIIGPPAERSAVQPQVDGGFLTCERIDPSAFEFYPELNCVTEPVAEQPDVPVAEQPDVPAGEEAPDTALPETGGPALLLPLAGLMVATGLGLAFIRRR